MQDKKQYVVVDIETTGLSKFKHGITEIAAVRFDGACKKDIFQTLVNPERHIPLKITKLTGISNEMVVDAPLVAEALSGFRNFLGDDILVAHNATFDYGFLSHYSFEQFGNGLENEVLCTRKLANRLLPDLPSKSLFALCEHFSVINTQAHRALADVEATVQIFTHLLEHLSVQGIADQEEILAYQNRPRYLCSCR